MPAVDPYSRPSLRAKPWHAARVAIAAGSAAACWAAAPGLKGGDTQPPYGLDQTPENPAPVWRLAWAELPAHPSPATAPSAAPLPPPKPGPPRTARTALDPGLSLEHRRYLLYLYARLNDPAVAVPLAQRILADNPGDKQTLLVLASMYQERKERDEALRVARTLIKHYPRDHQALYFLGAAYYLAGQHQAANQVFRELKTQQFKRQLYPYTSDLASAALKAQDWYRGMLAYQDLLRHHSLSEELRLESRKVLEGIYREHLPSLTLQETAVLLNPGVIFRTAAEYRQHLTDQHRLGLRLAREDVGLAPTPGVAPGWHEWDEGRVGLESTFSQRWKTEAWIGWAGSGWLGGVGAQRTFGEQRDLKLTFYGHEPATEGLLLEALDGRENRLELAANYLLERNWLTYGRLYGRELVVEQESLGLGYGLNWNLEHIFLHQSPGFRVGYRLNYARFQASPGNLQVVAPVAAADSPEALRRPLRDGLVLEELHRHGLYGLWRDQLSGCFEYHIGGGVDYAVERGGLVYDALAGFRFYPRKSLELRAEAGYSSATRTSDLASDQWQINIGLRYWF